MASQSTTEFGGEASRAVDGDTNVKYGGGSCTHTYGPEVDSWWMVDLGYETNITRVEITNRDSASKELHRFVYNC